MLNLMWHAVLFTAQQYSMYYRLEILRISSDMKTLYQVVPRLNYTLELRVHMTYLKCSWSTSQIFGGWNIGFQPSYRTLKCACFNHRDIICSTNLSVCIRALCCSPRTSDALQRYFFTESLASRCFSSAHLNCMAWQLGIHYWCLSSRFY